MRASLMVWLLPASFACAGADEPPARTAVAPEHELDCVVSFLEGAELQIEAEAQLDNLRAGLNDLATQPFEVLRTRRYRDYQGNAGQWTLPHLLERHFVPPSPRSLESCFWQQAPGSAARAVARRWIGHIDERVRGTLAGPPR